MTTHPASCRCGQLSATATGTPVRVSVCHCLDCQKRSGSAFAAQVRFPAEQVKIAGDHKHYAHSGANGVTRFHFCPDCGSHLSFRHDNAPDSIAIPLGAFRDPKAFTPAFSMFESRKHDWVEISGETIEHD